MAVPASRGCRKTAETVETSPAPQGDKERVRACIFQAPRPCTVPCAVFTTERCVTEFMQHGSAPSLAVLCYNELEEVKTPLVKMDLQAWAVASAPSRQPCFSRRTMAGPSEVQQVNRQPAVGRQDARRPAPRTERRTSLDTTWRSKWGPTDGRTLGRATRPSGAG